LAAIVLDAGGRVKAFQKQDGASLMRFEIAYGKAFAALALNRSSRQVLQKAKEKPPFMASLTELADGPVFLEAGGQLIRDADGEIVGAMGVTGDVNEVDDLCAIDGIHAGGFRADADFDAKAARRLNIAVTTRSVDRLDQAAYEAVFAFCLAFLGVAGFDLEGAQVVVVRGGCGVGADGGGGEVEFGQAGVGGVVARIADQVSRPISFNSLGQCSGLARLVSR